jgi:hypothetical protein
VEPLDRKSELQPRSFCGVSERIQNAQLPYREDPLQLVAVNLQFTSSGGRGEAVSRQVKSRFLTFYEGINKDGKVKSSLCKARES